MDDDLSGVHALWFWGVGLATRPSRIPSRMRRAAIALRGESVKPSRLMKRVLASSLRDRLVLFIGEPPA